MTFIILHTRYYSDGCFSNATFPIERIDEHIYERGGRTRIVGTFDAETWEEALELRTAYLYGKP